MGGGYSSAVSGNEEAFNMKIREIFDRNKESYSPPIPPQDDIDINDGNNEQENSDDAITPSEESHNINIARNKDSNLKEEWIHSDKIEEILSAEGYQLETSLERYFKRWKRKVDPDDSKVLNFNAFRYIIYCFLANEKSKQFLQMHPTSNPPVFPMYVMPTEKFITLSEIPCHEDALASGLLMEVVEVDSKPGAFHVHHVLRNGQRGAPIEVNQEEAMFSVDGIKLFNRAHFLTISHQWCRPTDNPAHPDTEKGDKCKAISLYISEVHPENFIWMDYFSIPQSRSSRESQERAIKSLPFYFTYSSTTLILSFSFSHFSDRSKGYLSRGHCLLELATCKMPRIDILGKWYIPGFDKDGKWGKTVVLDIQNNHFKELTWDDFKEAGSPLDGNFTVSSDKNLIKPLLVAYLQTFIAFDEIFLNPMRRCMSWKEFDDLPNESKPQTLVEDDGKFDKPGDWADWTGFCHRHMQRCFKKVFEDMKPIMRITRKQAFNTISAVNFAKICIHIVSFLTFQIEMFE
jgi:hypothetical protein